MWYNVHGSLSICFYFNKRSPTHRSQPDPIRCPPNLSRVYNEFAAAAAAAVTLCCRGPTCALLAATSAVLPYPSLEVAAAAGASGPTLPAILRRGERVWKAI